MSPFCPGGTSTETVVRKLSEVLQAQEALNRRLDQAGREFRRMQERLAKLEVDRRELEREKRHLAQDAAADGYLTVGEALAVRVAARERGERV